METDRNRLTLKPASSSLERTSTLPTPRGGAESGRPGCIDQDDRGTVGAFVDGEFSSRIKFSEDGEGELRCVWN